MYDQFDSLVIEYDTSKQIRCNQRGESRLPLRQWPCVALIHRHKTLVLCDFNN
jgi:hypothetical protein